MLSIRKSLALLLGLALLTAAGAGSAQEEKKEPKKEYPDFKEVVTDEFTKVSDDGFLILYRNDKEGKLYAGIPNNLMGKEFLLATSVAEGQYRGFQWDDWLLRFEEFEKKILIYAPNTQQTAEGQLQQVVNETYPDALIATAPILTKGPDNSYIIDVKGLLASNFGFGWYYALSPYMSMGGSSGGQIVKVSKAKSFPDNVEIELKFIDRSPVSMHYSIARLRSSEGFKPRVADQRVGYFLTARVNFSRDKQADTMFDRYINRWHIAKADPSLELSTPAEPIIFYIEDTVPPKYRRWVREGILSWNKAFEKIGIVGAIQVRQQTETNEFKDFDPENAQYNFFRWITSGSAFAMGPSRVNPRTGEILDADIIFDEAMLRYWLNEYELMIASLNTQSLSPRLRQYLARHPREHPMFHEIETKLGLFEPVAGTSASLLPEQFISQHMLMHQTPHDNPALCNIGSELALQMAFANLATQYAAVAAVASDDETEAAASNEAEEEKAEEEEEAEGEEATSEEEEAEKAKKEEEKKKKEEEEQKKKDLLEKYPEEMVGQMIRFVVAHEVGHTIGLRHNFKASSWKTLDEILAHEDPNEPTVASVMDYVPFSVNPDGTLPKVWVSPAIGPYDEWAVEYGYAIPGTGDYPKDEAELLKKIASRSAEPGHDYLTDEDLWAPDPRVNLWDLGREPIEWAKNMMLLSENIQGKIMEAIVDKDESWDKARRAYRILLAEYRYATSIMTHYVGGHYIHRDHKGDPNARPPIEVVDAEKQREAMKMLVEKVLAKDAFKIDPELQRHLAAARWSHWGSYAWGEDLTFPIQDAILNIQRTVLFSLLNPDTVTNLYDAEFRVADDVELLTLPEMLQQLTDAIWSELGEQPQTQYAVRSPMISNLRRNLQREHLSELIQMAIRDESTWYPAISRTLAWKQLKDLDGKIENLLGSAQTQLDAYTLAHLEESQSRIKKALEADFQINSGGGGFPIILLLGSQPGQEAAAAAGLLRPGMAAPAVRGQIPPSLAPMLREAQDFSRPF